MTHLLREATASLQRDDLLQRSSEHAASGDPLIGAYFRHMLAANLSLNTIVDRTEVLLRLHADMPHGLPAASTPELEGWLGRLDWKPATRYTYHGHAAAFFCWAITGEYLDYDPMRRVAKPRRPEGVPNPISDTELCLALAAATPRWNCVLRLAAYAGLRAAEIGALKREHVTEQRIRIVAGKGGRDAFVPTSPEIWEAIEPVQTDYVAAYRYDRASTPHAMSKLSRAFFTRIGLVGVHLHRLRHWYCTALLEAGVDLATVSKLMRHQSVQTTMGYLAVVDSRREAAIRLLPRFGSEHGGTVPASDRHGSHAA